MNYSATAKTNPGHLSDAIHEWWQALAGELMRSGQNAAASLSARDRDMLRGLASAMAATGAVVLVLRLAEAINWQWFAINTALKIANWL